MRIRTSRMVLACVLAGTLVPAALKADFELPILYPVPKTISMPEEISRDVLPRFAGVKDLTIEVRMTGGNMMRDVLVNLLNEKYRGVNKRIVLQGEVSRVHANQLRRLDRYEVVYRIGPDGLGDKTFNALYALGPVRKSIEIPEEFSEDLLGRIGRLKFYVPVFRLSSRPFDPATVEWIFGKKHHSTRFFLPADIDPARIYDLLQFQPISLRVRTVKNRIPEKLFNVLKDLRGVEVVVVVNGRLTLDDVKHIAGLERFSLVVELGLPPQFTPGLVGLLNRVAPP